MDLDDELRRGFAFHQQGRLRDAAKSYRRILQVNSQHSEALNLLGVIAGQVEKYADAEKLLNRAIALEPTNPHYHFNLACTARARHRHEVAILHFQEAIKLRPDYVQALLFLGDTLREAGNPGAAMDVLNRAWHHAPESPDVLERMGFVAYEKGDLKSAVSFLERTLKINPGSSHAHYGLGLVAQETGDSQAAVRSYQEAVRIDPENSAARTNLELARKYTSLP